MSRKNHRKSRYGCVECKRRHVKCDESFPVCDQCSKMELQCEYQNPRPRASKRASTLGQLLSPLQRQISPNSALGKAVDNSDHEDALLIRQPVIMVHMELLYHFQTETCKPIARTEDQVEMYRSAVVNEGLANPFLMHQILAQSALHLSLKTPTRAGFYHSMALDLQSRALAGYHEVLPRLDASNCVAAVLFSHALALHVFCETFMLFRTDFNGFLEKLVDCISLLMGINMVIMPWWDDVRASPIGSIMSVSNLHRDPSRFKGDECNALWDLIEQADLSRSSIETCQVAVKRLQNFFDTERALGDSTNSTALVFSWLVTTEPEFRDLIGERRPEVLVVLAYYAVILDKRRGTWAVADAGRWLLASITAHLGKRWEKWLAWPISVVGDSSGSQGGGGGNRASPQ